MSQKKIKKQQIFRNTQIVNDFEYELVLKSTNAKIDEIQYKQYQSITQSDKHTKKHVITFDHVAITQLTFDQRADFN